MIDLDAQIKTAMKAKDPIALTAYRSLKQKAMLKLNEAGRPTGQALTDDELATVVKREIKERAEANGFMKAGDAMFDENVRIVAVLETHLPKGLDAAATEAAVQQAIATTGAAGVKDFGKVMGALKKTPGLDMAVASARVKALLDGK
jgi:uncharacterized protein